MNLESVISASRRRSAPVVMHPAAIALITAMTTVPDSTRQALINTTITDLDDAGIWDKLDGLWLLASHSEQSALLNWITTASAAKVSTPTFTIDRGFVGGTGKAINTNVDISAVGSKASLDSLMIAIYSRSEINAATTDMGVRNSSSGTPQTFIFPRQSGNFSCRLNVSATPQNFGAIATSLGMFAGNRYSSTGVKGLHNGIVKANVGTVSTGITTYPFYLLAMNTANTSVAFPSSRENAFAAVGASLTDGEHASFYTIIQSYMTAIGAAV